ncbi:MAG: exodeoxyribonuclease large subunit, partial [Verrucomicrobiota bacterium]
QDFIRIIIRRKWRGRIVVLPTRVQGEGAAAEMAAMLRLAEQLKIFDLLVIGRGGGSLEDLWAFNEEALVRAVAGCGIPVISAVGHEIDFSLCDFAADRRAETPSAAAELITSHFVDCADRMGQAREAMLALVDGGVRTAAARLDHARSRLRLLTPGALIEQGYLRLDDLSNRLGSALRSFVQGRKHALAEVAAGLQRNSPEIRVQQESHRLLALWKRLQAASPKSVLNRGFVLMRDEAGRPVTRRAAVTPGQGLAAEFADGVARVKAE